MHTAKLRQTFLDYFKQHNHEVVASSSLVPKDDPTLLFTNAGMVQFKDLFLGRETRDYVRATTSQRCVRAGGKHNDLENVGFTARHHTFFEMLGNFSFGDYFKREAIYYAWEFITKVLALPPERLWVTVYEQDDEAADIWLKDVGISKDRFSRCNEKDNFWAMGDTGPCGPCSEIFYDHGADVPGGPPGSATADGDRYIEIWNLVFMQYNRDISGQLTPLPRPSVDTGMGLERIAAVMQGVHNNYEIDIFKNLIQAIANSINVTNLQDQSLKVIADHLRACAFLVADGILPANEGRGYVLRRIMRRAIRHGYKLGANDSFFHKLVPYLITEMGSAYPELKVAGDQIVKVLQKEELQFAETLEQGLKILARMFATSNSTIIPGDAVFKLYDTYGFPVDLTADIAREKNMTLDIVGFEHCMQAQRERARKASNFSSSTENLVINSQTEFKGYAEIKVEATVVGLYKNNEKIEVLQAGDEGIVILDQTAFYAESGGQIGDSGVLHKNDSVFIVQDTKKINQAYAHYGVVKTGQICGHDKLAAEINVTDRMATDRNHSATHLLHAAMKKVLGPHVVQKGSVVDTKRLRFDFAHFEPITSQQLLAIEILVNQKIQENSLVTTKIMPIKEALATGAMALFEEKYAAEVRVIAMGEVFSIELCGGTHVKSTGEIGFFKILAEEGIAAGTRRIEAITGLEALHWVHNNESLLQELALSLKTDKASLPKRVAQILQQNKALERDLLKIKRRLLTDNSKDLASAAKELNGIKVIAEVIEGGNFDFLREMAEKLKNQLGTAIIVLATINENKVELVVVVSKDCTDQIKASDLVKYIAAQVGGSGGGRAEMAQAGGNQPEKLATALSSVFTWISEKKK